MPKPAVPNPLQTLGWQPFFAQQTDANTLDVTPPVRVTQVHRTLIQVRGNGIDATVAPPAEITVGDWILLNHDRPMDSIVLERKSLIKRRAAGHDRSVQLIAANIDTAFVVTSCNADFNIARLERYIALAFEADVTPVILLTKSDMCDDADIYVSQASALSPDVAVIALNATDDTPVDLLAPWCKPGQTVAFLGSSGVGKSTLTNALAGSQDIATGAIREDDARGRHTTTHRHLHILPSGCAVLDTPGMRELQLTDASSGVDALFADLFALATQCKFNDCAHGPEPGCAIQAALAGGTIDRARYTRWQKLLEEDAHNTETLAMRKARDKSQNKSMSKTIKGLQQNNKKRR
ncbi:MAG: ribosome small subunit-dependent GTPase A [Paracoccaceae bacterium]|jgi:ribosome biogenesis GTPase|nr:ribosome small subunit-dependent GTPase A [Paracoccaceae bacterium]